MSNLTEQVESLVKQVGQEQSSLYALQFSQAALNAANALRVLVDIPSDETKT